MFGVSFSARELGLLGQNGDGAIERGLLRRSSCDLLVILMVAMFNAP